MRTGGWKVEDPQPNAPSTTARGHDPGAGARAQHMSHHPGVVPAKGADDTGTAPFPQILRMRKQTVHSPDQGSDHMRSNTLSLSVLTLLATASITGCDSSPSEPETMLESVRQATASFSSTSAALAAGYVEDAHCVAHPHHGAMGYHWVNQPLVDPEFNPMQPEALLYVPTPQGGRELVGVEYIVVNVGQPAPDFEGHPFDVGGVPPLEEAGVAHWSLHVWAHSENPSGTFSPFNPDVSCD
jgi:hypothetical protein